jgi:hypothetical protein
MTLRQSLIVLSFVYPAFCILVLIPFLNHWGGVYRGAIPEIRFDATCW